MLKVSGRLLISFFIMLLPPVHSEDHHCKPSSCGNIRNISYPFRLSGDPQNCGLRSYELSCDRNHTTLQSNSVKYRVEEINYVNSTLRVVDVGVLTNNCSELPLLSFSSSLSFSSRTFSSSDPYDVDTDWNVPITFISCATPPNFNTTQFLKLTTYYSSVATTVSSINMTDDCFYNSTQLLYVVHGYMRASDLPDSCTVAIQVWAWQEKLVNISNTISLRSIYNELAHGFYLKYWIPTMTENYPDWMKVAPAYFLSIIAAELSRIFSLSSIYYRLVDWFFGRSYNYEVQKMDSKEEFQYLIRLYLFAMECGAIILFVIAVIIAIAAKLLLTPFVVAFLVYKWRRRHLSMYDNIEDFIQTHNNLRPIRYSYSDIKKMTNGFKHKLGQGGYGSVFKGMLRSGHLVAVKILDDSKANGQDFINEVATIGRIHHFNVAPLVGFCAERSKRALLYNFMPNGSLEKYIFPREDEDVFLSFEKLHTISLGIARGIEYLHQGCVMQILHFDIKPHNILLDENFTPKVSDFGLAKLYPTDDSIVNLTAVRGTMGYMAPELFYKNIGGVSYKSDVYSYGMLLMEMASRRKNSNQQAKHSSQQYFPSWAYDQFCDGKDIEMGDVTDEERNIVKRMMIVAFWCIQWKPSDRPSMTKVVEMLEGHDQLLMPPKLYLSGHPEENHGIITDPPSEFSTSFENSSDTISLIINPF